MGDGATVAGMVNGMIGGTILVLPLLGLKTGYITTIIVNLLVGYTSYYTANLYVVHLGK
jgi:amino acid permease